MGWGDDDGPDAKQPESKEEPEAKVFYFDDLINSGMQRFTNCDAGKEASPSSHDG